MTYRPAPPAVREAFVASINATNLLHEAHRWALEHPGSRVIVVAPDDSWSEVFQLGGLSPPALDDPSSENPDRFRPVGGLHRVWRSNESEIRLVTVAGGTWQLHGLLFDRVYWYLAPTWSPPPRPRDMSRTQRGAWTRSVRDNLARVAALRRAERVFSLEVERRLEDSQNARPLLREGSGLWSRARGDLRVTMTPPRLEVDVSGLIEGMQRYGEAIRGAQATIGLGVESSWGTAVPLRLRMPEWVLGPSPVPPLEEAPAERWTRTDPDGLQIYHPSAEPLGLHVHEGCPYHAPLEGLRFTVFRHPGCSRVFVRVDENAIASPVSLEVLQRLEREALAREAR